MSWWSLPGPGDEATWPPYYGHPNDPRNPDDGSKLYDDEEEEEEDYEEEE